MSYSGLGSVYDSLAPPPAQKSPYDYLTGGPGLTELARLAKDTVDVLRSGQGGNVQIVRSSASDPVVQLWVPASEVIAAVWGGHADSAVQLAWVLVLTLVRDQMTRVAPANRKTVFLLSYDVVLGITSKMLNGGDPAGCQVAFDQSVQAWLSSGLTPVIQAKTSMGAKATPTGWCPRDLIFGDPSTPCQLTAVCKVQLDSPMGNYQYVSAPPPPSGALVAPQTASPSAPQPPPTHAQLDAAAAAQTGTEVDPAKIEAARTQAALSTYLTMVAGARHILCFGLGLPDKTADAVMWSTLRARGIEQAEVIDWINGCDGSLDCFRQHMNAALGYAAQRATDGRVKLLTAVAVAAAIIVAWKADR